MKNEKEVRCMQEKENQNKLTPSPKTSNIPQTMPPTRMISTPKADMPINIIFHGTSFSREDVNARAFAAPPFPFLCPFPCPLTPNLSSASRF